jgi:hypothetical protein
MNNIEESTSSRLKQSLDSASFVSTEIAQQGMLSVYNHLATARLLRATTIGFDSKINPQILRALMPLSCSLGDGRSALPLDLAIDRCFSNLNLNEKAAALNTFPAQISNFIADAVVQFFGGSWARAINAGQLGRVQYLATLQNMHQYVRFTTRLLGLAVACSPNAFLRNHYAQHLSGEVNHEILIERDLRALEEDTTFLLERRFPNASTRMFMSLQQSLVSFERDPVLFAACPLAAEAVTAHMDPTFLSALVDNVGKFSTVPKKATTFFASHIQTDGGDDGHWQATVKMLSDNMDSDQKLGEFLVLLHIASSAFKLSFDSSVDDLRPFSSVY